MEFNKLLKLHFDSAYSTEGAPDCPVCVCTALGPLVTNHAKQEVIRRTMGISDEVLTVCTQPARLHSPPGQAGRLTAHTQALLLHSL